MGGFLGIDKSAEEEELERQNKLRQDEIDKARRDAAIRLAERKAKKGQETAKIKLGTKERKPQEEEDTGAAPKVSSSLGLGAGKAGKTGVQL